MAVEIDTARCPVCDTIVSDHEPGVSSVMMGGLRFHPNCAQVASAESGDRYDDASDLEEPNAELDGDWHLNDPVRLPDDIGPTRESIDEEYIGEHEEMQRLLKLATKEIERAMGTLCNAQYDKAPFTILADLLVELGDYAPDHSGQEAA